MFSFLQKILAFTIIALLSICAIYYVKDKFFNSAPNREAAYLWGDSQMFLGIDPDYLSKLSNRKVYTMAQNGAGIYDFVVFSEKVPSGSKVIISISNMMLMKDLEGEYNRSGICFEALKVLSKHRYSVREIWYLLKINKQESTKYLTAVEPLPFNDSLVMTESFSNFEKLFQKSLSQRKEKTILDMISKLKEKNCQITFVSFPIHEELANLISDLPANDQLCSFYLQLKNDSQIRWVDLGNIKNDKNLLYDLDHFNALGRHLASEMLNNEIHLN
jgi:hypothetical protein